MPKYRVLRRIDAFVDYIVEIDAAGADEATAIADEQEERFHWKRESVVQFDSRLFVALDADGNEVESSQRGDF